MARAIGRFSSPTRGHAKLFNRLPALRQAGTLLRRLDTLVARLTAFGSIRWTRITGAFAGAVAITLIGLGAEQPVVARRSRRFVRILAYLRYASIGGAISGIVTALVEEALDVDAEVRTDSWQTGNRYTV